MSHPMVPDPWSSWLRLIHVPARSWMDKSHLFPWVSPNHIRVRNTLVVVLWTVCTGQLGEAWALEPRETLSVEEFIHFSKDVLQFCPLGSQGVICSLTGLCFKTWREGLGSSSCSSFPEQCPDGSGAAGFGRKGWECALHPCRKGFAGSTPRSTKPWGAKSRVALSPETN